ncbi:zinc-binding protein A33-like [Astyanax mexicanus]|uniref:Zinc-binding protein A33-like n=1 Tax=Astyanax mexicanus TaxID=7994 RepID=A0A8T2LQ36_ASTMX|nr:zinc-binding protein A33-like [Astyanax mexicanus]
MAQKLDLTEKELSCHLCCHIYEDPVLLPCHHSFCQECLQEYWESKKTLKCPVCKKPAPKGLPPANLQLQAMCDRFRQERRRSAERHETLCDLHKEKLKLFCLEDKEPVCVVCKEMKLHSTHNFRPLDEAATEHRVMLRSKLKPLQEKLNSFLKAKLICDQTAQHIKSQAQQTERHIKEEFQKLHQFLREEEKDSLSALKEEEEVKSQKTRDTISRINDQILHLSQIITSTYEELSSEDTAFLQKYKEIDDRTDYDVQDPEILSEVLIDTAKHLGNLKFRVWEKMKDMITYTPVILDSNTAHRRLALSNDLTSFVCQDEHRQIPENPERFDHHLWVLGSEGFSSGSHYWDVEVENCKEWALGVVTGAMQKGKTFFSGIWKCHYENILYGASSTGGPTDILKVRGSLRKIRVQLDWDEGKVLFYNLNNGRPLQTFSHKFTAPVFPYFCNQCKTYPLRILPKEISIAVPQECSAHELAFLATYSTA